MFVYTFIYCELIVYVLNMRLTINDSPITIGSTNNESR